MGIPDVVYQGMLLNKTGILIKVVVIGYFMLTYATSVKLKTISLKIHID